MRVLRDRPRSVDLDEFMARPLFAHVATASDEGPRVSPVWFLWEDDALWILGNTKTDTFPVRIEREPRCAVAIVDFDRSGGVVHHVGLRGAGRIEPFDRDRAIRLLSRYLGDRPDRWDARFRESLDDERNLFVRFEPETVVARDQSYDAGVDADEVEP